MNIAVGFAGLLLAGLLVAPAQAQAVVDTRQYIYIEAKGTVWATADRAVLTITVSRKADGAEQAAEDGAKAIKDVFDALAELGIAGSDIATTDFTFETAYILPPDAMPYQRADPNRDKADGFRITNQLAVTISDLDRLGAVLAKISALGAGVDSLKFKSSQEEAHRSQARRQAAMDARARATLYAEALDVDLGGLLSMREGVGYSTDAMEPPPTDGSATDIIMLTVAPASLSFSETISTKWAIATPAE